MCSSEIHLTKKKTRTVNYNLNNKIKNKKVTSTIKSKGLNKATVQIQLCLEVGKTLVVIRLGS